MSELNRKIATATKWSVVTELAAKVITPALNMVLARLFTPEAFGILATVTMVIAFAEVFVESGFSKYLIQHKFESDNQEQEYMSVAFWVNLFVSLFLWALIAIFNESLAVLVGNPGLGHLLVISGVSIPLYSVVGIQSCKLKKDLNFKKLFYVRLVSAMVPLFVTVPLALLKFDYWALIIGSIAGIFFQALLLAFIGNFKPIFSFRKNALKEMLSFGIWTLLNGLAVWLTNWMDSLLIGRFMNDYYLGLYKNSTGMIISLFGMVTSAIVPVLFSSLSKMQNDDEMFASMYQKTLKNVTLFVLPMGVGVCIYSDLATDILLGSQWVEATNIIAVSAISTALRTIFVSLNGDVYRAKGHYKTPLILQLFDIVITIPICCWALKQGFWMFVYVRALLKLALIIPEAVLLKTKCNIAPSRTIKNLLPCVTASLVMGVIAVLLHGLNDTFVYQIVSILLCALTYLIMLLMNKNERIYVIDMLKSIRRHK